MTEPGLDPTGGAGGGPQHELDASEQYLENMIHTLRVESENRFNTVATAVKSIQDQMLLLARRVDQVDRNAHA